VTGRRSDQLNYASHASSNSLPFPPMPSHSLLYHLVVDYVRSEHIDIAEGRISQTCNRTEVMQELPDFVLAFSHHFKPRMRDGSHSTSMRFQPCIDGRIAGHILQLIHNSVILFSIASSAYLFALIVLYVLAPGLKRVEFAA
jgi:hypothetical protein